MLRDELLSGPVDEQRLDLRTVLVQLAFAGAFRPSDRQAGSRLARKADQEIAEGCNRLIRNSIICWKYLYSTHEITLAKTEEERKRLLDIIETHSPQSWGSFNMLGDFDFSDEKLQDTTGVLPPKSRPKSSPKNRGRQIDDTDAVSIGYQKSYGRFGTFA